MRSFTSEKERLDIGRVVSYLKSADRDWPATDGPAMDEVLYGRNSKTAERKCSIAAMARDRKGSRTSARGNLCRGAVGRHQDGPIRSPAYGSHRLAPPEARPPRARSMTPRRPHKKLQLVRADL